MVDDPQSKSEPLPAHAQPAAQRTSEEPKRLTRLRARAKALLTSPGGINDTLKRVKDKEANRLNESAAKTRHTIRLLTQLVGDFVNGRYRDIAPDTIVAVLAALLYFLLPLDAIPDFILALGMIDDFAILTWVARNFQDELDRYRDWLAHQPPSPATNSKVDEDVDVDVDMDEK